LRVRAWSGRILLAVKQEGRNADRHPLTAVVRPKAALRSARRTLRLSPMQRLLRKLRKEGVRLSELKALEVFAATGERHVLDYVGRVKSLEVWEIDASCDAALRSNLPGAEIKITDSFAEAARTEHRYGFVVVDNPTGTYGGGRCEHFDLFPYIFRLLVDQAVVVINVLSKLSRHTRRKFPYLLDDQHLARRRAFYQTDAEDLPLNAIAAHYRTLFEKAGFAVDSAILQRRRYVHYLALKVHRRQAWPSFRLGRPVLSG
jgi:hypothetical protein